MLSFGSQQEGDDLNNLNAVVCVVETGAFFVFFMSWYYDVFGGSGSVVIDDGPGGAERNRKFAKKNMK